MNSKNSNGSITLIALLVLSFLMLLMVTLSWRSLGYVRQAGMAKNRAIARQHARTGLMAALAELQEKAGPDTRITYEGALLDTQKYLQTQSIEASTTLFINEEKRIDVSFGHYSYTIKQWDDSLDIKPNVVVCDTLQGGLRMDLLDAVALDNVEQSSLYKKASSCLIQKSLNKLKNGLNAQQLLVEGVLQPRAAQPNKDAIPIGPVVSAFQWGLAFRYQNKAIEPYLFAKIKLANLYRHPLALSQYHIRFEWMDDVVLSIALKEGLHLKVPREVFLSELMDSLEYRVQTRFEPGEEKTLMLTLNGKPQLLDASDDWDDIEASHYVVDVYKQSNHAHQWPEGVLSLNDGVGHVYQKMYIDSFPCDYGRADDWRVLSAHEPVSPDIAWKVGWRLDHGCPHLDHYNPRALEVHAKQSRCCWRMQGGLEEHVHAWHDTSPVNNLNLYAIKTVQTLTDLSHIDLSKKDKQPAMLVGQKFVEPVYVSYDQPATIREARDDTVDDDEGFVASNIDALRHMLDIDEDEEDDDV